MASLSSVFQVIFGVNSTGFNAVKNQTKNLADTINNQFNGMKQAVAGYFTLGAVKQLAQSGIEMAVGYKRSAESLGMTTREVQYLEAAAHKVGLSFEDAGGKLESFTKYAEDARTSGDNTKLRILERYGVTAKDLDDLRNGSAAALDIVKKMADPAKALGGAGNVRVRRELGEIFGGNGMEMVRILDQLHQLGPVEIITDEEIQRLAETNARLKEIQRTVAMFAAETAEKPLSFIAKIAQKAGKMWEDTNQGIVTEDEEERRKTRAARIEATANRMARDRQESSPQGLEPEGPADPSEGFKPTSYSAGYTRAQRKIEADLGQSAAEAYLRFSTPNQRRAALPGEISRLRDQAMTAKALAEQGGPGSEGKQAEYAQRISQAQAKAAELAEMQRLPQHHFSADSVAAVGGMIGGAAMGVDPNTIIFQDMRSILKQIYDKFPELNPKPETAANALNQD